MTCNRRWRSSPTSGSADEPICHPTSPAEAIDLRWSDVDLKAGRLAVRRALIPNGRDVVVSEPKTIKGRRLIALDPGTVEVSEARAARQLEEQGKRDEAWVETGLVCTQENGEALDPESVSRY